MSSEETTGGGGERRAPGLRAGLSKQDEVEDMEPEEDTSPSSEASDATIVPNTKEDSGTTMMVKDISPEEQCVVQKPPPPPLCTIAPSEVDPPPPENNSPTQTSKTKLLVRSHAVSDDASPPPPEEFTIVTVDPNLVKTATLQVSPTPSRSLSRHKLSKDSSQGSTVSENGTSPGLSRDSSVDYTDSTGTDLELFLKNTLNSKQHKDRQMLLKLEREMIEFIKDTKSQFLKFPQMTSYHRMLVHRVAAFFGLDHNVDQSGKSVVVNRTNNTRLPDFKFRDHILDECIPDDQPKRLILKRDIQSHSFEESRSDRVGLDKKSKSFEERAEEYDKARARIFSQPESQCGGHLPQQEQPQQPVLLESHMGMQCIRVPAGPGRKEDLHGRPWSSTDSGGYSTDGGHRGGSMTKASSFGGVSVLSRADSSSSTRGLSATDSMSSGVSSLSSPMTRPPTIPSSPPPASGDSPTHFIIHQGEACSLPAFPPLSSDQGQPMAIWVATCLDKIPPGSVIINPQTCQPYTCADGSYYRWPGTPSPKPVHTPVATGEQRSFSLDSSSESLSASFSSMGMGDGSDQQQQQQQHQQPVYMMAHSTPHSSQPQTQLASGVTPMGTPVQYLPPVSGVRYMYSPGEGTAVMYGHFAPPVYAEQQQYYTTANPNDLHQQQQQQQQQQVFSQQQQQPQPQPQQVFNPQQQQQQQAQPAPVPAPQAPAQQPIPAAAAAAFQARHPAPTAQYVSYSAYPAPATAQPAYITATQPRGQTPPAQHQIKVFSVPSDQQQQQRGHTPDREQPVLVHKALPPTLLPPHRPPQPRHPGELSSQRLVGHPLQQMSGPPRPLMQISTQQPPRMVAPNSSGTITPVSLPPPTATSSKTHRARKSWSNKQQGGGSSSSSTDTPTMHHTGHSGSDNPAAVGNSDLIIPSSSSSSSSSPSPSTA